MATPDPLDRTPLHGGDCHQGDEYLALHNAAVSPRGEPLETSCRNDKSHKVASISRSSSSQPCVWLSLCTSRPLGFKSSAGIVSVINSVPGRPYHARPHGQGGEEM
ncbi:hypothetical protein FRB94_012093 [Tulasnella sp. JGI-2019a]|nr:hypothetical protein FRB93_003330 [Tulasnella sp. JGI-2019a]KAG8992006.1 hypothetical protein FRB94_012093 [Tulasnella sp. JGI-2019a]